MLRRGAFALVAGLFIAVLLLLPGSSRDASDVTPIDRLVDSSDLIVLARIGGIDQSPMRAELRVMEVWKGETVTEVAVPVDPYREWPASSHLVRGDVLVAFLRRAGDAWSIVEMADAERYQDRAEFLSLKQMVLEAVRLRHERPSSESGRGAQL